MSGPDVALPPDDHALEALLRARRFGPPEPDDATPWDFVLRWPAEAVRARAWPVISRLLTDDDGGARRAGARRPRAGEHRGAGQGGRRQDQGGAARGHDPAAEARDDVRHRAHRARRQGPSDVRKLFYPDWAAFVGALSVLQTAKTSQLDTEEGFEPGTKEALVGDFKAKALASFHADGKDITAMFTTTARGGFLFKGKKLAPADLEAAVPADGLGRAIGSGAVEGQIKVDVAKTDWLAAHAGQPAPSPEVIKAWAMEQIKAAPKKIATYADGPALVKYPGWVFPTPDIKMDAVFSEYCDLLALYASGQCTSVTTADTWWPRTIGCRSIRSTTSARRTESAPSAAID